MAVVEEVFIAGYYKIQTISRQTVLQTMKMGRKKRGSSTFGCSNDLQDFRSQGGGEYTQVGSNRQGLCLGPMRHYTPVMGTHSIEDLKVPHTFSVCYRDTLENHVHIASSASFIPSSICTNTKEKYVLPSFVLSKKKNLPKVDIPILPE